MSSSPLPVYRPWWGTLGRSTGSGAPGEPGGWCRRDLGCCSPVQLQACRATFYPGARAKPRPSPGPGPCWSIGQSVPLRTAWGAAALCLGRTPQQRRPHGGRATDPSSGLYLLFLLLLPVRLNPVFPPPPLFFLGHPGQLEPVMTARVAGGRRRRRRRRWKRKSGL